jgi:sterol desaturase/sphingolipid hydroxylase (fatty acid hydroxylase superfamily)
MRLKKILYFADFAFYPLASVALVAAALLLKEPLRQDEAAIGFACGLALWSLAEYLIHRFALHGPAYLAALHDMHHSDPRALVGSPLWLSLGSILCGSFLPVWLLIGFATACVVTAGLMLGYIYFSLLHHIVHHHPTKRGSYLWRLKRRHARHHYGKTPCNFGVVTSMWDRVFGTFCSE